MGEASSHDPLRAAGGVGALAPGSVTATPESVVRSGPRPILAINYYFGPDDLQNRIFDPARRDGASPFLRSFREFMRDRGGEVVTLDAVDFNDPAVKHVLYFDDSWRYALRDHFLRRIPREKRALIMLEPSNVNPSLYITSSLRDRFHTIFTWDLNLLRRNPGYVQINVPVGGDPLNYRDNPFRGISFEEKKLLVAVNTNRWSYVPRTNFGLRIRAFQHFDRTFPGQFDLYGQGWNAPRVFYEKCFGFPRIAACRGWIDDKVKTMAHYRFALCIENNAFQPGYISEKITDCFCARCVPIYYGWKGAADRIPHDAWIDMRDFRNLADVEACIRKMDAATHQGYLDAIDRFMRSERIRFFSNSNLLGIVGDRLGLRSSPEGSAAGNGL